MSQITDLYKKVYAEVENINVQIRAAESELADIRSSRQINIPARIERLEELLVKIDKYEEQIKKYQELAKRNLRSQNVLTIEAPPGYRVNLNRLRKWAMLIDPYSDDDPYAQRLLAVAKCDECFLEQKRKEFTRRISELIADQESGITAEMQNIEERIAALKVRRDAAGMSEDVFTLAKLLTEKHASYCMDTVPAVYSSPEKAPANFAFGCSSVPLNLGSDPKNAAGGSFGDYYDGASGKLFVPVSVPWDSELIISVTCTPSMSRQLDHGLQNFILQQIDRSPAGSRKIYVTDGLRFNSNSIGSLRQLEGSFALAHMPRNPEQLTSTLEQIVASFADMDDMLDMYDSVREYNENHDSQQQLPYTTLIIYGWPGSYSERDRDMIRRIMINYERYGVSCIIVTLDNGSRRTVRGDLTDYAMQNAIRINMNSQETTITRNEKTSAFRWYSLSSDITPAYAESVSAVKVGAAEIGNEYTARYSLTERPGYTRSYRQFDLPVGIDGRDEAQCIDFDNENFASYLVGAAGSGKSTLIHTLIAGLIRNYHPDNVELWLADFKQLEFKRYMKHLPPHVKYVLLDESPELVYDLVDKLTEEMLERQRLFARLGKQKIEEIDTTRLDKPLPVIFVILDEFSIMSQAIADAPIYQLRLQNILAKGRALGIKFLFASQTFTTGVRGLTSTARAQIQQRIAMKGSDNEISETLELSSNLKTDQVRNWMEALPPHYALIKYRRGADVPPMVKRLLVMYFKDYAPRDRMIDDINASMHAVTAYDPSDISSYVDKAPVLVDGNSYSKFDANELMSYVQSSGKAEDEFLLSLGVPRLMTAMKPAVLSAETRENIIMIARAAEHACAASVIMSAMKSFALQKGKVQIWAYPKHPLYKEYRTLLKSSGFEVVEGIDDICDEIRAVRKTIEERESTDKLIVMIGMDRICMDFELAEGGPAKKGPSILSSIRKYDAAALSEDTEEITKFGQAWVRKKMTVMRSAEYKAIEDEASRKAFMDDAQTKFSAEYYAGRAEELNKLEEEKAKQAAQASSAAPAEAKPEQPEEPAKGAYNAAEDFVYIIRQGSRNGIHFMLNLNSLADLKSTGVKADMFRHRLMFQTSADDSRSLITNKAASLLPEHICLYDDTMSRFSFRPYIHPGIGWEGWYVDAEGVLVSPFAETEE